MARTLNPASHAVKRDAFLEAAQRLIQSKGYEQTSLQDVLDEIGASKGAFYHYFDSKEALLAATVDRMVESATAPALAIVADTDTSALDKLVGLFSVIRAAARLHIQIVGLFSVIAQWKGERIDLMRELIAVWFSDANLIVRDQLWRGVRIRLPPLLAAILRQGNVEGTFNCTSPERTAGVFVALLQALNETTIRMYLARRAGALSFEEVEATLEAYAEALERVLGLEAGSWPIVDKETLHFWFD